MMDQGKNTRVAVASDQDVYRRGLVSLVLSLANTQFVGEARDSSEAVQLCEMLEPDILLLDIKNIPQGSREFAHTIHLRWPQIKIVLMLNSHDEQQDSEEYESEDFICLSKDITEDEFSTAIQDICLDIEGQPNLTIPRLPLIPDSVPSQGTESITEIRIRELEMAGKIQADILPEKVPVIPGWDLAVRLVAARETSGDFFDFIPIGPHRLAIVIADVIDKGIGAALFMALTSTLIRTYAVRYPTLPALTMDVVNQRMLSDTRGSMFVTVFYGILETDLGRLRFVNAGHPPALMVGSRSAKPVDQLQPTGMALGLIEKAHWRQKVVKFMPGDVLLLYTDGITEAQNGQGEFYGVQRLMRVLRQVASRSCQEMLKAVLADIQEFAGDVSRHDDIALIALCRKGS